MNIVQDKISIGIQDIYEDANCTKILDVPVYLGIIKPWAGSYWTPGPSDYYDEGLGIVTYRFFIDIHNWCLA